MREFSYDPLSGVRTQYEDLGDEGFALHTTQDVAGVLDDNKAKRNAGREYYAADKDMWRVASIPAVIQMDWLTKHGVDLYNPEHTDGVKKLLNSSEYRYLKTAEIII